MNFTFVTLWNLKSIDVMAWGGGDYRNYERNSLRKLRHESLSPEVADFQEVNIHYESFPYFIICLFWQFENESITQRGEGPVHPPYMQKKNNIKAASVSKLTCSFWTCDMRGFGP